MFKLPFQHLITFSPLPFYQPGKMVSWGNSMAPKFHSILEKMNICQDLTQDFLSSHFRCLIYRHAPTFVQNNIWPNGIWLRKCWSMSTNQASKIWWAEVLNESLTEMQANQKSSCWNLTFGKKLWRITSGQCNKQFTTVIYGRN